MKHLYIAALLGWYGSVFRKAQSLQLIHPNEELDFGWLS